MSLQLEFDYRFSRCMKERMKRKCKTKFCYYTSPYSHYPQISTSVSYSDLPRIHPPKANKLTKQQAEAMRTWRSTYGQSVPQKTVRNLSTKDNPGTLPVNLYVTDPPKSIPVDMTSLLNLDTSRTKQVPQPEIIYSVGQMVCVKEVQRESNFIFVSLRVDVRAGTNRVKGLVFLQDPFNPLLFTSDERLKKSFHLKTSPVSSPVK